MVLKTVLYLCLTLAHRFIFYETMCILYAYFYTYVLFAIEITIKLFPEINLVYYVILVPIWLLHLKMIP